MSGLNKIIEKIHSQGDQSKAEILENARKQAEEIVRQGEQEAQAAYNSIVNSAAAQCEKDLEAAISSGKASKNRALLRVKVEAVNSVLEQALETIRSLPDQTYFDALLSLARKYVSKGEGTMCLSQKDLDRMPEDFEKRVNGALAQGGSICISKTPAEIPDGFILNYGETEENCTLEALLAADSEAIKDKIAEVLFA